MYKSMFRPEVIRGTNCASSDLVQNFHPCLGRQKSTTWLSLLNAQLMSTVYKPCAMCLSLLHFQPCAGSEPDCNCCLSNKYTCMQLRSPEVTRVNFHLSHEFKVHQIKKIIMFPSGQYLKYSLPRHHSITC